MPHKQFLWNRNGGFPMGINLTTCPPGSYNVICPSSIRIPMATTFEDLPALDAKEQCTVRVDVSDMDGSGLRVSNIEECVFVEGKLEAFNGKTWVYHQICRRLPLPRGYQVKSVRAKLLSNSTISLTVDMKMEQLKIGMQPAVTKSVLLCEGRVLSAEVVGARAVRIKLTKIKTQVINYARKVELDELINLPPAPSPRIPPRPRQHLPRQVQPKKVDFEAQTGRSYCGSDDEDAELIDEIVHPRIIAVRRGDPELTDTSDDEEPNEFYKFDLARQQKLRQGDYYGFGKVERKTLWSGLAARARAARTDLRYRCRKTMYNLIRSFN